MQGRRSTRLLPALVLAAAPMPPVAAQVIEPYAGVETYMRFCASCHGVEGQGDGPVAAAIPRPVPDLTRLADDPGGFDAATLRSIIDGRSAVAAHGPRTMPVWGYEFWIEEGADAEARERVETIIANLVAYLRSIQR